MYNTFNTDTSCPVAQNFVWNEDLPISFNWHIRTRLKKKNHILLIIVIHTSDVVRRKKVTNLSK